MPKYSRLYFCGNRIAFFSYNVWHFRWNWL